MWKDHENDSFSDEYESDVDIERSTEEEEEYESGDSIAELLLECENYTCGTESNLVGASHICCVSSTPVLMANGSYAEISALQKGDLIWTTMGNLKVLQNLHVVNSDIPCFQNQNACGSAMVSVDGETWFHMCKGEYKCDAPVFFVITEEPIFVIFSGKQYIEIDNSKVEIGNDISNPCSVQFNRAVNGCVTHVMLTKHVDYDQ